MEIPIGSRVKMCARKNATPQVVYSSEEEFDDSTIFMNSEASRRFAEYFRKMGVLSEKGFTYDNQEEDLGIIGEIGTTIRQLKWMKLCRQPGTFNTTWVREFYANLTDPGHKKSEVIVRGTKVVYDERTINLVFNIKDEGDEYQHLMNKADEDDFEVIMQSLCTPGTTWVEYTKIA